MQERHNKHLPTQGIVGGFLDEKKVALGAPHADALLIGNYSTIETAFEMIHATSPNCTASNSR